MTNNYEKITDLTNYILPKSLEEIQRILTSLAV